MIRPIYPPDFHEISWRIYQKTTSLYSYYHALYQQVDTILAHQDTIPIAISEDIAYSSQQMVSDLQSYHNYFAKPVNSIPPKHAVLLQSITMQIRRFHILHTHFTKRSICIPILDILHHHLMDVGHAIREY